MNLEVTNAVESVNSSFLRVTKKGAFPDENACLKPLFLPVRELQDRWDGGHIRDWSLVPNQLIVNEKFTKRIQKYGIYLP